MTTLLALHTWTLDTTPLADLLRVARDTGWAAVELRRLDFVRAAQAGSSAETVIDVVRTSGLPVACVGVEFGWMLAEGAERRRLLTVFDEQCARAAALGCRTVMSPVDKTPGDPKRAADSVREVGDIAARHGVRLAVEFNSQVEQFNRPEPLRDVLTRAAHPHCGLLLDSYHLGRQGVDVRALQDLAPAEIAYVQYSDVPRSGLVPGEVLNRLPPGQGSVPFREFFQYFADKGYAGYFSYEAPNPVAWARDPKEVAREAIDATRAVLSR